MKQLHSLNCKTDYLKLVNVSTFYELIHIRTVFEILVYEIISGSILLFEFQIITF